MKHTITRNRKRSVSRILIGIGIVFVGLICIMLFLVMTQKPKELTISDIDMTSVSDGTYTGSADNGLVKASVSVVVNSGKLQSISILKHDNLLGKPGERIIDDIIKNQSLEVDAISSATYSSDTIRKAVENALHKGE